MILQIAPRSAISQYKNGEFCDTPLLVQATTVRSSFHSSNPTFMVVRLNLGMSSTQVVGSEVVHTLQAPEVE